MCAGSAILDYGRDTWPKRLDDFYTLPKPVEPLRKNWDESKSIVDRLYKLDKKLGDEPACDMDKGAWMDSIEKRLSDLENKQTKGK